MSRFSGRLHMVDEPPYTSTNPAVDIYCWTRGHYRDKKRTQALSDEWLFLITVIR